MTNIEGMSKVERTNDQRRWRHAVLGFVIQPYFVIRISSLFRFASAQKDHANCRYQDENPNDLKWQIVIAEKQRPDIPDIVNCRSCKRRESPAGGFKVANDQKDLDEQD